MPVHMAKSVGRQALGSLYEGERPLGGEWPYLWLDATYIKQRQGGRIVSVAAIIAVAATTDGRREIIGLSIGDSEAMVFWMEFLRRLVKRGLKGVKLVIGLLPVSWTRR